MNTDFTAKLVDVYPDVRAIRICEGIIRTDHQNLNTGKYFATDTTLTKAEQVIWDSSSILPTLFFL